MNRPQLLPNELVFDILSRLPVKSLLRFKCVCKSWLSIITHPKFIKTHLRRSTTESSPDSRRRLLVKTYASFLSFLSFDFETTPDLESQSLEFSLESNSDYHLQPLCSWDGLILLPAGTSESSFILWNPSIRSYKTIQCPYELSKYRNYGLCCDSTADDYWVFILSQETETFEITSVLSYSLRNDSWNMVIDNRYDLLVFVHEAIANGAVHWLMFSRELDSLVIVYFDFFEGKLKEVMPPRFWKHEEMSLMALGGFLCVYSDICSEQIEIYVMKEYGNEESWTRLYVIPGAKEEMAPSLNYVEPLCLTKEGQLLISVGNTLIGLYNPKDGTFLWHECDRRGMAIPYVETLLSPNGLL